MTKKKYIAVIIVCAVLLISRWIAFYITSQSKNTSLFRWLISSREEYIVREFEGDKAYFENVADKLIADYTKTSKIVIIDDIDDMKGYGMPREVIKKYNIVYFSIVYREANESYIVVFEIPLDDYSGSGISYVSNGFGDNDIYENVSELCEKWFFYKNH